MMWRHGLNTRRIAGYWRNKQKRGESVQTGGSGPHKLQRPATSERKTVQPTQRTVIRALSLTWTEDLKERSRVGGTVTRYLILLPPPECKYTQQHSTLHTAHSTHTQTPAVWSTHAQAAHLQSMHKRDVNCKDMYSRVVPILTFGVIEELEESNYVITGPHIRSLGYRTGLSDE